MAVIEINQVVISKNPVATKEQIKISVRVGEYALQPDRLPIKLGGNRNGIKS